VEEIIGLIPAAGRGVRLGLAFPKELYPVPGYDSYMPVSRLVVENIVAVGVKHIVFVINEAKHQLIGFLGDGHRFLCNFSYVVQESQVNPTPSTSPGLAHALDAAYHLVRDKTVFFAMADTIMTPKEVFASTQALATSEYDVLLTLFPTVHPEKFGMVRLNPDHKVEEICDKPGETDLIYMWGCIIWRPKFTEHLHTCVEHGETDFATIMNKAITDKAMRFEGVHIEGSRYIDLGTHDELKDMYQR
jgi:glucose-1-phosphate thymidylyltransferase